MKPALSFRPPSLPSLPALLLLALPLALLPSRAASGSLTLHLENDAFAQTDRQYTHGCGLFRVAADAGRSAAGPMYVPGLGACLLS